MSKQIHLASITCNYTSTCIHDKKCAITNQWDFEIEINPRLDMRKFLNMNPKGKASYKVYCREYSEKK
jgi:hypothetical protein